MAPTARSPSPPSLNLDSPPLPLSKRDKRRTLIQDKLNEMLASFNSNMRPQWDAQINAIYADLALINRADPYGNAPLDTSGEGISRLVEELRLRPAAAEGADEDGSTEAFDNTIGRFYRTFAEEVNDALEARDVGIAQAVSRFEYTMQSLKTTHDHRILVAYEEHKLLSESIRARLVQTLTTKRARLMREKEQLDISDSNSMLLHPAQFSMANPSSPGGPNHPRKTRHARHRIGDPDDPAAQENKRKRKAVFDEERDMGGSPGPSSKNIEFGNGSPFRDAKAKTISHQYEAPAYSIDRLFSEKELALNMNMAQTAVRHFLIKLRTQENGANGAGDPVDDQDITMGSARGSPAPGGDSNDETELPHPSTRAHLRGHVHGVSTRTLPTVALPPLVLPVPFTNNNKIPTAPPPSSLSNAEAEDDLAIITGSKPLPSEERERILDHALSAGRGWEASYWSPGDGSAADHIRETSRRLVLGMEGTQDDLPGRGLSIPPHLLAAMEGRGATPTSNPFFLGTGLDAQAAGGGFGGVPMSRNGSANAPVAPGGVGMRRTGSGQPGEGVNGHGSSEGGGRSFLGRGRGRGRGRGVASGD